MRFFVRRFGVAILAVSLFAPPLWSQSGTIIGRVTAAETAGPVQGADVSLIGPTDQTVARSTTDASGRFVLSNVAPGTYALSVSLIGYTTQRVEVVRVVAGTTTNVPVSLTLRAVELNPIQVTAGKRVERILDAPARVEVIDTRQIEERPTVTPVDHLRSVPGIDVATSGVQSTNVVARGFNNVFSGALHALTDHRIAGVPSLRVNFMHFIPSNNEDIERMEVVLGPGAALYGPNTANGVLHILTRSPLVSQGTTVAVAGGEQSVFHGAFRTSHLLGENFGIKLSGQYLQANEWEYRDPAEVAERLKFDSNPAFWRADLMRALNISETDAQQRIDRIADRDFDLRRWSGEARADWRITNDLRTTLSIGSTTSTGIELTGLGAGQADNWRYTYYQARANYGQLFGQVYLNTSDAGETYLLRNGAPIVDRSKLLVTQLQHGLSLGEMQSFTYGADYLYTMPETEGTINGMYEDEDETREWGVYLQSETRLHPMFDVVLAGRVDNHSALPEAIFSPRAAFVFKPFENQAFRVTYNRAFSTPSSLNQFLDLGSSIPDANAAALGYSLRIQGTGADGIRIRQPDGSYLMRSPGVLGGPPQLIPAHAAPFYPAALAVVAPQLRAGLIASGLPELQVNAIIQFLGTLRPTPQQISSTYFHPSTQASGPLSELALPGIDPIREETSTTYELGYKGILGQRVLLAADVWFSRRRNLITPLTIATPFVRLDVASSAIYLTQQLTGFFMAAGLPQAVAQQQATALAPSVAGAIGQVPVGVVSSEDINANGAQLLVTYFNVDDELDVYGSDLSATALLSDLWSLSLTGSLVNKDVFETREGERVTLNAPRRKGSVTLNYRSEANGLSAETRVRHTAGFPVNSGVYIATQCLGDTSALAEPCIEPYTLLDLSASYRLPMAGRNATLQFNIHNLLDENYRSFPGSPEIGRMALLRLKWDF